MRAVAKADRNWKKATTNDFIFLGASVKVCSNGVAGEDPGDTNEDVRTRNDPNGDRSRIGETTDTPHTPMVGYRGKETACG